MAYEIAIKVTSEADAKAVEFMEGVVRGMVGELKGASVATKQSADVNEIAARSYATLRGETDKLATSHVRARAAFIPLASAVSQTTALYRDQSPAITAVVGAVDNLVFSVLGAAAATGSLTGALSMFAGPAGLITGVIITAGAALAYYTGKAQEAKKAQDDLFAGLQKTVERFNAIRRDTELLGASTDRQRLEVQLMHDRRDIMLQVADVGQRQLLLDELAVKATTARAALTRQEAEEIRKQLDAERKALEAKAAAEAQALEASRGSLVGQIEAQRAQTIAFIEGEKAAILYRSAIQEISEPVKRLGEEGEDLIRILRDEQLALLANRQALDERNAILKETQAQGELAAQIERVQADEARERLKNLRDTSIDVAGEISRVVTDITSAVIAGTLKWADIGRSVLASFARVALEEFTNFLRLAQQSGGGGLSGLFSGLLGLGGGTGGAGGGAGGAGGGVSSPSSGGGIGIGSIFSSIPFGSIANLLGFNGGGAFVGTLQAGATALASSSIGAVSSIGSTVSTVLTTLSSYISWIPYIGWAIAAITSIYRIISNQQERPNARLSGQFEGVAFDESSQQFVPGAINVGIGRKVGIKNSQAGAIADSLQQRLGVLSDQWVGILNLFPDVAASDIMSRADLLSSGQTGLETTNARLNQNFANLKFSPGGSRSIQQELEAMSGPDGLARFFQSFQPSLGVGFWSSLTRAGIPGIDTTGFQSISPGWQFPQEDWDKFIEAIKSTAALTGGLATVGASKFLTPGDLSGVGSMFSQLFATTDPKAFTEMAGKLTEQLKPVTDFMAASMQQAAELFGRGLMAALEAATESDALANFNTVINVGLKDAVFSGITESLLATAEFNDLMAPLQKAIRESVQHSMETGNFDLGAAGIGPALDEILSRAERLAPIVAAFQDFGEAIKERLGLIPPVEIPVEIPVEPLTIVLNDSTTVFGQGLIAAMEAATNSDARLAFQNALGVGIKDTVLQGLTEAFIASAQFKELLAPIQDQIKLFVEHALATGTAPDVADFRSRILPSIEEITTRGELLGPLIEALRELGFEIKGRLGLNPPPAPPPPQITGPINITVNSSNAEEFMQDLERLLSRLPPT